MELNSIMDEIPEEIKGLLDSNDDDMPEEAKALLAEAEHEDEKNTDNVLDNSSIDAILKDNAEEKPTEAEPPVDFDAFVKGLPVEKQEIYRYAKETNWDYDKWRRGEGKSAELWVYTEPYVRSAEEHKRALAESRKEIRELRAQINSVIKDGYSNTKSQAQELLEEAQTRLKQADEAQDYNEAKAAYQQMQLAQKALKEVEHKEKALPTDVTPVKLPDNYQQEINRAGKSFSFYNRDWIFPESPNYDPGKLEIAKNLEIKFLNEQAGLDPDLLYTKIQIELDKLNSKPSEVKETPQPLAPRKSAIEHTSSVRSAEFKQSTTKNKVADDIIHAIASWQKSAPSEVSRYIDPTALKKLKGIK